VAAQALVGIVQYYTGVPEALVSLHVAGAAAVTAASAAVWAHTRQPLDASSSTTASTNRDSAAAR
jgi:cytochrome c oxidase assembly protein subunit 15